MFKLPNLYLTRFTRSSVIYLSHCHMRPQALITKQIKHKNTQTSDRTGHPTHRSAVDVLSREPAPESPRAPRVCLSVNPLCGIKAPQRQSVRHSDQLNRNPRPSATCHVQLTRLAVKPAPTNKHRTHPHTHPQQNTPWPKSGAQFMCCYIHLISCASGCNWCVIGYISIWYYVWRDWLIPSVAGATGRQRRRRRRRRQMTGAAGRVAVPAGSENIQTNMGI